MKQIDRKQLYNLVWSKPMTDVAPEFGLSDRGMAKLCERYSVPVPPRGYWAKNQAGQKVKKSPLVMLDSEQAETITIFKRRYVYQDEKVSSDVPDALQIMIRSEIPLNEEDDLLFYWMMKKNLPPVRTV